MRAVRGILFAFAAVAACASCLLVTGSTDGYDLDPQEAGATRADGSADATGLSLGCISAVDCASDGGAAVCCLSLSSLSAASTSCQAARCSGSLGAQLCATDAECGDASCVSQQCSFAGAAVNLRACGKLLTCVAR